jgi:hypothetical protein
MKRKLFRCFALLIMSVMLVTAISAVTVSAESSEYVPYESYTYWTNISGSGRKLVQNKTMYTVCRTVTAKDLGVESFTELVDICTDNSGSIYLLDSASRIVVLDKNYNYVKEITEIKGSEAYSFSGAQNVYVHTDGTVYICDTSNNRVLCCDADGSYIDKFTKPDSPLIPADFSFQPISVSADSRGYVYVLCKGSYYGALLYAPDKSFIGFYGANSVTNGILGAVQSLWKRMFPNNERSSKSTKTLPYSFNDIIVDSEDFVYTVTDSATKAQIKKLNPGAGNNILGSDSVNFADDEVNRTYLGYSMPQRFVSVATDENNFIYCLDAAYGRIYLYDSDCRMITAFGGGMGVGTQLGTFSSASALALNGDDVLVCDKVNNTLTVFACNSYGKKVKSLLNLTLKGNYLEAKQGWNEVLLEDKNLQVAYNGLARAYLAEKNYSAAMKTALDGYDRETYALAYKYQRKIWVSDNFFWIFGGAVLIIGAVLALIIISMKKKTAFIKNEELRLMFLTLVHPGISFETVKDKHKGSLKLSFGILILFYVTAVIREIAGGFLFTGYDPESFNSLWMFVQSMGLVVLWIASNVLVCQILEGNGTVREIIVVTSYSLMPIVFERIVWTALTNFLLPEESTFLGILSVISIIWAGLLLITGMMRIHEYSFGKFIGTTALTLAGMAAIAFLIVLVGILLQQLGGFAVTVVTELLY